MTTKAIKEKVSFEKALGFFTNRHMYYRKHELRAENQRVLILFHGQAC